jgi:hypothetical protein
LLFGHIRLCIKGAGLVGASSVLTSLVNAVPMCNLGWVLKATCGSVSYALVRYYTVYTASGAANSTAGGINHIFHIKYLFAKKKNHIYGRLKALFCKLYIPFCFIYHRVPKNFGTLIFVVNYL